MQQYAMLFGTYLGAFLIVAFLMLLSGMHFPFGLFLFVGFTLVSPFLAYFLTRLYRDRVCDGQLSFGQGWLFVVMMYMFAALLVAAAYYIYFRYIDGGAMMQFMEGQLELMRNTYTEETMPGITNLLAQYRTMLDEVAALRPVDIAIGQLSSNFFFGVLLGIPIAWIAKRQNNP
jgi:hypothetical protein